MYEIRSRLFTVSAISKMSIYRAFANRIITVHYLQKPSIGYRGEQSDRRNEHDHSDAKYQIQWNFCE